MKQHHVVIITGSMIGLLSSLLVYLGNPLNMGICVACFIRDIAGALGLHRAEMVQYLRPEIPGFILGSFVIARIRGEFNTKGGSAPFTRFILGILMLFGAMVFLGCPLRMLLRLAGGDLTAISGILGFAAGIYIGIQFLKRGFSLGKSYTQPQGTGYLFPLLALLFLLMLVAEPAFLLSSQQGPGSLRAPIILSLGAGLLVGILGQRSRICTAGGIRDLILMKNFHLFSGLIAIFLAALLLNGILGQFSLGFSQQPIAHTQWIWSFLSMVLVGIISIFLGGCPLRQTILAGMGNMDSAITFMGMLTGAALAHNFSIAGSPAGVESVGKWSVLLGLAFVIILGLFSSKDQLQPSEKKGVGCKS